MTENLTSAPSPAPNQGRNTSTRKGNTKSGHQHHGKQRSQPVAKQRTPEEEKAFKEAVAKAEAAQKARQELVGDWEKRVEGMSYRQIRGELKRIKRGHFLGEPTTALDQAWATVADITMKTTKMRDNLAGQLSHYINPSIAASSPRYEL